MTRLVCLAALLTSTALAGDLEGGQAVESPRIEPVGGSGVSLGYAGLVGPDRGVNVWTASARAKVDRLHLIATVPVATFPSGIGQDTDIGNIGLSAWYDLPYLDLNHSMGLRVHVPAGENAYAWQNRPEELWPGYGIDLLWQGRFGTDSTQFVLQGSAGLHNSAAYAPFPSTWVRMGVSGALDKDLGNRLGLTTTLDLQTWDTSPIELSGALRLDIIEGLRVRGGVLLPLGTWMGATPTDRAAGVREATLSLSASMVL